MADRFYNLVYNIVANQAISTNQQMAASFQNVQQAAQTMQVTINNGYADLSTNTQNVTNNITKTQSAVDGLISQMLLMRAATKVWQEFLGVLGDIDKGILDAHANMTKFSDDYRKFVEQSRELAATEGIGTAESVQEQIGLELVSGAPPKEAAAFAVEMRSMQESVMAGGRLPGKTKAEQDQFYQEVNAEALAIGTQMGIGGETTAQIINGIMLSSPHVRNKEQVLGMFGSVIHTMQHSAHTTPQAGQNFARMRGALMAMKFADNPAEIAALESSVSPEEPAGRIATRMVSAGLNITTAMSGEHREQWEARGVTVKDRNIFRTLKVLKDIRDEGDAPGGPGAQKAFANMGISNQRSFQTILELIDEIPAIEANMKRIQEETGSDAAIGKMVGGLRMNVQEWKTHDPAGQSMMAKAREHASKTDMGMRGFNFNILMQESQSLMRSRGDIDQPGPEATFAAFEHDPRRLGMIGTGFAGAKQFAMQEQALIALSHGVLRATGRHLDKDVPGAFSDTGIQMVAGSKGVMNVDMNQTKLQNLANNLFTGPQGREIKDQTMHYILEQIEKNTRQTGSGNPAAAHPARITPLAPLAPFAGAGPLRPGP